MDFKNNFNSNALYVVSNNYKAMNSAELSKNCVDHSSFYLQREKNGSYQIQFTAIDSRSDRVGFELLQIEASILFQGQEYLIKQIIPDDVSGYSIKTVTATHVMFEAQHFFQRSTKNGTLNYKPQDIMSFIFDGNPYGFTWEVADDFDSHQIENLGSMSGQDALSKIVEVWPDAVIIPDNYHIKICKTSSVEKPHGNRLGYMNNVSEMKITQDSTNIKNQVFCTGKAKDKEDGTPDDAPPEYYFPPFLITLNDSVKNWTHGKPREMAPITDDRFTDAAAMRSYGISQLNPDPTLVVECTTNFNYQPIMGDLVRVENRKENLALDLSVVGYTWYPWDISQFTQVTLNNTAKTIFDYQNSLLNNAKQFFDPNNQQLNSIVSQLQEQGKLTQEQLGKLANKVDSLKPDGWAPGSLFVDVSNNNGVISVDKFSSWKAKGAKGVICKLTEGAYFFDKTFDDNRNNAVNAGLKFIGAYHLFHGNPEVEAQYFLDKLQKLNVSKNCLVICDIEDTNANKLTTDKDELTNQIKRFYQVLINAGYENTCDYASLSWFSTRFNQVGMVNWTASYGNSNLPDNTNAWQFTEDWNGEKVDASYSYSPIFV